ncbi:MAG TPA: DNA polymerase III subunit epsilon [Xanthomonadaceae bacterium]|nr:DNA polymerase III subunit epsilon [Xanthomonadaceae bacterium]
MSRRQIVLDTETTGLSVEQGHRIIEIGAVELLGRRSTGVHFHRYVNPGRSIDEGAIAVHGIRTAFLEDKPSFAEIAGEFIAFVQGAELLIHNAPFDVGFIDAELERMGGAPGRLADIAEITDTLALARELYPGQPNSLDRLCKRLGIDNSRRELHGALLDAQLLADVYLAMTSGQSALEFVADGTESTGSMPGSAHGIVAGADWDIVVARAEAVEIEAHQHRLRNIAERSGRCIWLEIEPSTEPPP